MWAFQTFSHGPLNLLYVADLVVVGSQDDGKTCMVLFCGISLCSVVVVVAVVVVGRSAPRAAFSVSHPFLLHSLFLSFLFIFPF